MSCCQNGQTVVVIGGGISGVGAARTLIEAGYKPIILESRDRLGGRICKAQVFPNLVENEHQVNGNFINVQFGANWIHGLNDAVNPMYHYAKKMGLLLHPTSSDDEPGDDVLLFDQCEADEAGVDKDNPKYVFSTVPKEEYLLVRERYAWIKEHFEEVCEADDQQEKNLLEAFESTIVASDEVFGPCSALHRRCLNWFLDRVAIDMGSPLHCVDKATYIEGDSEGQFGEAVIINGGYFRIFEALATEYPLEVRFNTEVTGIHWSQSQPLSCNLSDTAVTTVADELSSDGDLTPDHCGKKAVLIKCANGEELEADGCILTVPLGVLQTIDFQPSTPPSVLSLLQSLRPSLMNLVWIWYPTRFWPEGYNFLGLARPAKIDKVQFTTFLAPPILDRFGNFQPVLMCQVVGEYAEALESLTDAEIANAATTLLRDLFQRPGPDFAEVPDPIGCGHSAWKSETYSRGSWTLYPHVPQVVTVPEALERLSEVSSIGSEPDSADNLPVHLDRCDRLFYAGEATAVDHRGTVHGAFKSGILQANKLIERLRAV